ncbi:MAG TPA: hypothetical protein VFG10_19040 [Saprospiraceae bacterium]|nr:hypothetical protein [Saprospiraceae bacterium]
MWEEDDDDHDPDEIERIEMPDNLLPNGMTWVEAYIKTMEVLKRDKIEINDTTKIRYEELFDLDERDLLNRRKYALLFHEFTLANIKMNAFDEIFQNLPSRVEVRQTRRMSFMMQHDRDTLDIFWNKLLLIAKP